MRNFRKLQNLNAFIRTSIFIFSFFFTFLSRSNFVHSACPVHCSCIPAASSSRVTCGSGLTSFPANLPSNTGILFISVPASPIHQYNTISSLSAADVSGIKDVQTMTLIRSKLKTIAPSTFSQLTKLTTLDLRDNNIAHLSRSVFFGLSKLQSLDLSQNKGCLLDTDVFTDMNVLKTLRLGDIGLWDIGALLSPVVSLEELDLHGNNIFRLTAANLIHLNNLKYLDLNFNDLYNMEDSLKPVLSKLKSLHLEKNPWRCNCALAWIKTLPLQFIAPSHSNGDPLYCSQPPALRLKEVWNVADADMKCIPANVIMCSGPYSVKNGGRLSMTCDVEGDPFPDIKWLRPDGLLANQSVMTKSRSTVDLVLAASDFTSHDGVWKITAENYKGSDSMDFNVEIITTTTKTTTTTRLTTTITPTTTTPTTSTTPTRTVPTRVKPSVVSTTPSAKTSKVPHASVSHVSSSSPGKGGSASKRTSKYPSATSTTLKTGGISQNLSNASTSNPIANVNSEERSIIAIVVACISGGICVIGVCIFGVVVYKSKQKRRIRVRKRSTYSTPSARDPEVFTLYVRTPASSGRLGLN